MVKPNILIIILGSELLEEVFNTLDKTVTSNQLNKKLYKILHNKKNILFIIMITIIFTTNDFKWKVCHYLFQMVFYRKDSFLNFLKQFI